MAIHGGPAGADVGLADTHREFQLETRIPGSISAFFLQKTQIFRLTPRASSLEAQRLDDKTGHPGDPNRGQTRFFRASPEQNSAVPGPSLAENGPSRKTGAGERRHVIESISFSSQTAPQTPQLDPQTPQEVPQEGLENVFFSNLPGGVWGVS